MAGGSVRKRYMVKEIFSLAIAAETKARTLYTEFGRLFRHVPAAFDLWRAMAADEQLHEDKLIEMFKALPEDETLSLKDDPLFEKAESFVSGISIAKIIVDTLTLDDAYETAYALEYSEVNAVMRFVLTDLVPPEVRHDFTLSNVEQHVSRLEAFSKTVCDEDCRRSIKAISEKK
jgi:hypothetical protein